MNAPQMIKPVLLDSRRSLPMHPMACLYVTNRGKSTGLVYFALI
jgi:hypothetical protein